MELRPGSSGVFVREQRLLGGLESGFCGGFLVGAGFLGGRRFSQADKCTRWMPWHGPARKDVASCEKPRGAASEL